MCHFGIEWQLLERLNQIKELNLDIDESCELEDEDEGEDKIAFILRVLNNLGSRNTLQQLNINIDRRLAESNKISD